MIAGAACSARRIALAATMLSAVGSLPISAQTTISTGVSTCGSGACGFSAMGFNPYYNRWVSIGQTFTAPGSYQVLQDFSFWLKNDPNTPSPTSLFAYLVVLAGGGQVSQVLYKSGPFTPANGTETQQTFAPQGIVLSPNSVYFAFLTGYDPTVATTQLSYVLSDYSSYAGGSIYSAFDDPLQSTWYPTVGYSAAFEANLADATVTPEPATLILVGTGLIGTAVSFRRRRKDLG